MSFAETLKELRGKGANRGWGEWGSGIEELESLKKLSEERIVPILETVREVYVEGEGEIVVNEVFEDQDQPHTFHVFVSLNWDQWEKGGHEGGKKVNLHLKQTGLGGMQTVSVQGAEPSLSLGVIELGREDWEGDWKEQVEEAIITTLSTPMACEWIRKKVAPLMPASLNQF